MKLYGHYMTEIETFTGQLSECLRDCIDVQATRYFQMPRMTVDDERQVLTSLYPKVPVTTLDGLSAATECLLALSDWYVYENHLSRRVVHKHAGVLVVPKRSDFEAVKALCAQINQAKDNFKAEIQKSGAEAGEKWRVVHDRYNYLITLSLYRHINCYDADYDAAYFNWVTRPRTKRIDAATLVEQLRVSMAKVPKGQDPQQWKTRLTDEINDIEATGVEELVMRRQVNYRPEVNLRLGSKMKSYSAGLPIILPSLPERVSDLPSLDVAARNTKRRAEQYQLVVPRLNLYRCA